MQLKSSELDGLSQRDTQHERPHRGNGEQADAARGAEAHHQRGERERLALVAQTKHCAAVGGAGERQAARGGVAHTQP